LRPTLNYILKNNNIVSYYRITMAPLSPEQKEALLKRLQEGRAKTKAAREEAKGKGLPDPKPRKVRKDKKDKASTDGALADPLAAKPANDTIPPIDGAPDAAKNVVAAMPPSPGVNPTAKIDVPNLPDKEGRKKIVEDAEEAPKPKGEKGLSRTGVPKKINENKLVVNEETGDQAISVQYPGQKESIKRMLKADKKSDPVAPAPVPEPPSKTVKAVPSHTANLPSVEGRAPFSFSTVRKMLYQ
jgi:hypothetical protein